MHGLKLFILLIILMVPPSCGFYEQSTAPSAESRAAMARTPAPGRALLCFLRDWDTTRQLGLVVSIDGQIRGILGTNTFVMIDLPPGRHTIATRFVKGNKWVAAWRIKSTAKDYAEWRSSNPVRTAGHPRRTWSISHPDPSVGGSRVEWWASEGYRGLALSSGHQEIDRSELERLGPALRRNSSGGDVLIEDIPAEYPYTEIQWAVIADSRADLIGKSPQRPELMETIHPRRYLIETNRQYSSASLEIALAADRVHFVTLETSGFSVETEIVILSEENARKELADCSLSQDADAVDEWQFINQSLYSYLNATIIK